MSRGKKNDFGAKKPHEGLFRQRGMMATWNGVCRRGYTVGECQVAVAPAGRWYGSSLCSRVKTRRTNLRAVRTSARWCLKRTASRYLR